MRLLSYFLAFLVLPGSALAIASSEEDSAKAHSERAFVLASFAVSSAPEKILGFYTEGSSSPLLPLHGVFLERETGEPSEKRRDFQEIVWGAFLPVGTYEIRLLYLLVEEAGGQRRFFSFNSDNFIGFSPQGPDEVRGRIGFLREQIEQSVKDKESLANTLERLKKDAKLIGGFEAALTLEKDKNREEQEVKRIRSQVGQLRKSLQAIKSWTEPTDLSDRKQTLVKDIKELQEKLRK
ncbi:MAG: hypothetical protein KDD70_11630 [Bdellovibrionales bacterium]|nr:hypothetical protein [Bdellovibrionales bacterium]